MGVKLWNIFGRVVGVVVALVLIQMTRTTSAQLDLPSMPGPPYPDPRGQNRWGVKFDPRKHGPPFDKRGSAHRHVWHRGPPGKGMVRDRDRDIDRQRRPSRERDSFWSPGKMRRISRPKQGKGSRRQNRRNNRYYGNDLKRRRPRTHLQAYKDQDEEMSHEMSWKWPEKHHRKHKSSHHNKEDEQKFWKSWNAWYKKQIDVKEQLKKGQISHHTFPHVNDHPSGPTYYVDAEEFENLHVVNDEDNEDDGRHYKNALFGGAPSRWREFYWTKMKDMVRRAKSMSPFGGDEAESDNHGRNNNNDEEESKPEGWHIFTTIGKGLDAANQAMGSVRKTVGGSLIGTGVKYGGKMAMNAVMNVGTSALTSAIQTATLG